MIGDDGVDKVANDKVANGSMGGDESADFEGDENTDCAGDDGHAAAAGVVAPVGAPLATPL